MLPFLKNEAKKRLKNMFGVSNWSSQLSLAFAWSANIAKFELNAFFVSDQLTLFHWLILHIRWSIHYENLIPTS